MRETIWTSHLHGCVFLIWIDHRYIGGCFTKNFRPRLMRQFVKTFMSSNGSSWFITCGHYFSSVRPEENDAQQLSRKEWTTIRIYYNIYIFSMSNISHTYPHLCTSGLIWVAQNTGFLQTVLCHRASKSSSCWAVSLGMRRHGIDEE